MAVELEWDEKGITPRDQASLQALLKGSFGLMKSKRLELEPEEVLYLMDVRKASCKQNNREVSFNKIASKYQGPKFLARYYCYKDWRDRGLIARPIREAKGAYGRSPVVNYPSKKYTCPRVNAKGLFYYDDFMSIIDDDSIGEELYLNHWFGQFGTYKARKHGRYLKLDAYESLFLMKHGGYELNIKEKRLETEAKKRRPEFQSLYEVYEDFRLCGFVVKTGFKFGTHFRLYFPGASPNLENAKWMHSKHVVHAFPRSTRLLISEWARAIRVAHGVKKTFILAIPGAKGKAKTELDFLLYHRKNGLPENPKTGKPRFAMLALSEEEEIGGEELARAIEKAASLGLDLVMAICDRETSITYYRVKRIQLPKSKYEYYEIEWVQP